MKFSSQEEYGLRCLIQIGKHHHLGGRTIPQISEAEGISIPHVAKLTRLLRLGGFIESTRGQDGGYALSRRPEEISVADVLAVLGGRLFEADFCEKHAGVEDMCNHNVGCSVKGLWQTIQQAVDQVVTKITLKDLIATDEPVPTTIQIPESIRSVV
ncbi:Rrf2 family transcriptional regulator [bacterium]|nr:Rrf2 family transcriptional regulator [bacterium]